MYFTHQALALLTVVDPSLSRGVPEARNGLVGTCQGVGALGAAASILSRHAAITSDLSTRGPARVTLTRVTAVTPRVTIRELLAIKNTV